VHPTHGPCDELSDAQRSAPPAHNRVLQRVSFPVFIFVYSHRTVVDSSASLFEPACCAAFLKNKKSASSFTLGGRTLVCCRTQQVLLASCAIKWPFYEVLWQWHRVKPSNLLCRSTLHDNHPFDLFLKQRQWRIVTSILWPLPTEQERQLLRSCHH